MVDPWRHWPFDEYLDGANVGQKGQDERYRAVQQMAMASHSSRSAVLRLTSEEAAALIPDHSLVTTPKPFYPLLIEGNYFFMKDFCYIDAQHDYLSVLQDILLWWPKVVSGGILAGLKTTFEIRKYDLNSLCQGHDFDHKGVLFPVTLAVIEFARKMSLELLITGEATAPSWYIFKP